MGFVMPIFHGYANKHQSKIEPNLTLLDSVESDCIFFVEIVIDQLDVIILSFDIENLFFRALSISLLTKGAVHP